MPLIKTVVSFFCFIVWANAQGDSLRQYADKIGFNIGVAMGVKFDQNNQTHNNLVKKEFNIVVSENNMKAENIHPQKGQPNFVNADKLVTFAQQNNMKVRGHTLVWYNQNPDWLMSGTRQSLLENMKFHIETVAGHFKGKIYQWDVVNEAFADEGGGYRNPCHWYSIIGEDYIDSAFVYAHRADPDCKLFLNDYNNSYTNTKSTAIYNKVKKMRENGIPIHGVGFQCHERTSKNTPDLYDRVKTNFDRFAALGLEIAITEIDIRIESGSNADTHAAVYDTFLKAALNTPKCNTFMIWGVIDEDSWVGADQQALIFDNSFQPKPAYYSLLAALKTAQPISVLAGNAGERQTSLRPRLGSPSSVVWEVLSVSGARTATIIAPLQSPVPAASLKQAAGIVIIKTRDQAIRMNHLK
jgi:endo-1,4-beta-xylanase